MATCIECHGEGEVEHPFLGSVCVSIVAESPSDPVILECEHCEGTGECECDECVNTASENAFSDMCESEPPLSASERHQMAHREREELRR